MLEITPRSTMMKVSVDLDETPTSLRISAAISPAASARPTPIITTRMIATAEKFRKLSIKDVNRYRTPETVSRPFTSAVSVVTWYAPGGSGSVGPTSVGWIEPPKYVSSVGTGGVLTTSNVAFTSNQKRICETTITAPQSTRNR